MLPTRRDQGVHSREGDEMRARSQGHVYGAFSLALSRNEEHSLVAGEAHPHPVGMIGPMSFPMASFAAKSEPKVPLG